VPRQPQIPLGFVGLAVVEDGVVGHDGVHEGEELDAPAPFGVLGFDLTRGDIERGKQGAVAVSLVLVRLAVERAAMGQLEIALRPWGEVPALIASAPPATPQATGTDVVTFLMG
jgi:hypothetical protein